MDKELASLFRIHARCFFELRHAEASAVFLSRSHQLLQIASQRYLRAVRRSYSSIEILSSMQNEQ